MISKQTRRLLRVGAMAFAASALAMLAACSGGMRPPAAPPSATRRMVVTGYCKCGKCTGWHRTWYGAPVYSYGPNKGRRKDVGLTASGTKARHGTIAADTSLYPFGTIMYVPGYGYGRVEDRGGDIKGERLDPFFTSHSQAERWGRQVLNVEVWYKGGSAKK